MKKQIVKFGRQITDATEPLPVRIRPCDIRYAVCRDHQRCVIANAIRRTTKAPFVDVGVRTVIVGIGDKKGARYWLDPLGREVVRYFDENEGKAAPSQVVLNPAPRQRKIGARKGERHGTEKRKRLCQKPTR